MIFISFKALHGDSFLISAGRCNILIDGGTPNTYGQISNSISKFPLKAIFVTHVDYDHIGGIINLINDYDADISNCEFYMNHPDLAVAYRGDEVGYKHGDSLKHMLIERGKKFNSLKAGDIIKIDDVTITIFSPKKEIQDELYNNWNASKIIHDTEITYRERQINNGDIINKSSAIILITHNSKNILFLGDSHAETVCEFLKENSYSEKQPLHLTILKISHHGSRHNTNSELLKLINCEKFYISTNGSIYDHPDVEIIQLIQQRGAELSKIFTIYLNYDIEQSIREKCSFEITNIIFQQESELVLS